VGIDQLLRPGVDFGRTGRRIQGAGEGRLPKRVVLLLAFALAGAGFASDADAQRSLARNAGSRNSMPVTVAASA